MKVLSVRNELGNGCWIVNKGRCVDGISVDEFDLFFNLVIYVHFPEVQVFHIYL